MGKNTDAMQKKLDDMKWDVKTDCTKGTTPAPAKKDDKKPATPAKKDDKKPATPAKKDDKKPAPAKKASSGWDMKAKIGDTSAEQNWDAYITMPQANVDANMKFTWNDACNVANWKAFL